MPTEVQSSDATNSRYMVQIEDNGNVLECSVGPIMFQPTLPPGFYVTIINVGGGTLQILTPSMQLVSPFSATALTAQWQSVTVMRLRSKNVWWTGQL